MLSWVNADWIYLSGGGGVQFAAEHEVVGMRVRIYKSEATNFCLKMVDCSLFLIYGYKHWLDTRKLLRWFKRQIRVSPGCINLEVSWAPPTWGRPCCRSRTRWRHHISHLAWERLWIPQEVQENIAGDEGHLEYPSLPLACCNCDSTQPPCFAFNVFI